MIDNKNETLNLYFVPLQTPQQKILDGLDWLFVEFYYVKYYPSLIIYVCLCKI